MSLQCEPLTTLTRVTATSGVVSRELRGGHGDLRCCGAANFFVRCCGE